MQNTTEIPESQKREWKVLGKPLFPTEKRKRAHQIFLQCFGQWLFSADEPIGIHTNPANWDGVGVAQWEKGKNERLFQDNADERCAVEGYAITVSDASSQIQESRLFPLHKQGSQQLLVSGVRRQAFSQTSQPRRIPEAGSRKTSKSAKVRPALASWGGIKREKISSLARACSGRFLGRDFLPKTR